MPSKHRLSEKKKTHQVYLTISLRVPQLDSVKISIVKISSVSGKQKAKINETST
jgi:hypothetical protein